MIQTPKPNRAKELESILVLCVALVVIFLLAEERHDYLLVISIVLGVIGMFFKSLAALISRGWMKVGELLGAVMGKVILSVVFFVFLFPIALLSRVFSKEKSNLQLKRSDGNSYYFTRNHKYEAKDLENVW